MKINLLILTTILSLTALWTFWSNTQTKRFSSIEPQKIENFTYTDINGNTGHLYDHEGVMIFIHFWATWCAPCIVELPDLVKLAARNKEGLIVLAISKDKSSLEMKKFINTLDKPLPNNIKFIWDQESEISESLFNIYKLPETIIVKPNLTLQEKVIGAESHWNSKKWMDKIAQ